MRISLFFTVLILFVCSHSGFAQAIGVSDRAIALRSAALLSETVQVSGPGVAVLIARGEKVIFRSARGSANIELAVALSPDHSFRIASITKPFVAALVVKLSESGDLSLDDNLSRFLPEFPEASRITIRQLLSHTAGISDEVPVSARQPGFSRRDVETAQLVNEIAKRPLSFAPGSDQSYSNAGYILLGAVIERVTGKPWHMALQERVAVPLHLKHTTYGEAAPLLRGRVAGYTTNTPDKSVTNAPFLSLTTVAAAGALVSNLDDLRTWMRLLIKGKIIDEKNFQRMTEPTILPNREPASSYGLGIYIWRVRGERMIGHTGQINGFASVLAYLPSSDITIVALGNDDTFDAQNFGRRLAAIAIGKPYPPVKGVPISATDLSTLAGRYRDGGEIRTLLVRDGRLYSQRGNRNPSLLQMTFNGRLHFVPDELTYIMPVKNSSNKIMGLDYFERGEGPPRHMPRIDE